jgi:signal transduction histidine kinase
LKNIKRIQNQLNYLSEYAKKLAGKSNQEEKEFSENLIDKTLLPIDDIENEEKKFFKLTKNDISRIDLESVTNSMSEGLIIYSMDLEVVMINPALAQMLMPANPKGTGRLILNPDDSLFFERCNQIDLLKKIQRALIEEPTRPRSDILELKNPKQVLKRFSSPLYDKNYSQIGHIIIYHDMTAEAEIEELRKDFISSASHELRTPVTSIKLLLESLVSGAKDDPVLLNDFLNDLCLEADRLHQLVNDLLDIAKMESEKNSLNKSEFEVFDFLKEAITTITPLSKSKDVKININSNENINIIADKRKLRQIIVNLVTNAVKFTPAGGNVLITAKKVPLGIEFKIKDSGIGIPQDDQAHIFEKFYCVNKERSRVIGGSGLGLTIVKQIIEAHKGRIDVKSVPGNTVFTFLIPQ